MRSCILSAAFALATAPSALAQPGDIWEPCLTADASMEGVIAAFQADGWTFPADNESHVDNLKAAAEVLLSMQNLPPVETGEAFDRHIAVAHERAEQAFIDSPTLQRDDLSVTIEAYENAGGMIRCTIAGTDFADVTDALAASGDDVVVNKGRQSLMVRPDIATGQASVTYYALETPQDATAEALGPLAVVLTRHLQ